MLSASGVCGQGGQAAGRPGRGGRARAARRGVDHIVHAARVHRPVRRRRGGRRRGASRYWARVPAWCSWRARSSTGGPTSTRSGWSMSWSAATATGASCSPSNPSSTSRVAWPPKPAARRCRPCSSGLPLVVSVGEERRGAGPTRRGPRAGAPGSGGGDVLPPRAHRGPPGAPDVRGHVLGSGGSRPGTAGSKGSTMRRYILTVTCPDRVGIVAAVTGLIASMGGSVLEAAQHGDLGSGRFFLRIEIVAESPPASVGTSWPPPSVPSPPSTTWRGGSPIRTCPSGSCCSRAGRTTAWPTFSTAGVPGSCLARSPV